MRLRFLNSATKRLGFAFGITALLISTDVLFFGGAYFSLYYIIFGTVIVYIPVTIIYAVVSTFFTSDEGTSEEILDD